MGFLCLYPWAPGLRACLSQDVITETFLFQRLIDKTRVTCLRWIPGAPHHFLVSHASGHMYVYNEDLQCGPTAPVYQLFKSVSYHTTGLLGRTAISEFFRATDSPSRHAKRNRLGTRFIVGQ